MKIFGSPDTFVEVSSTNLKLGRLVANFDFLRAVLQYGDFDEYHLFCPTQKHVTVLQEAIQREITDASTRAKIHLFHHLDLQSQLQTVRYSVFHVGGWYFYYLRLAYLRAQHARYPFVLTGIIHSLNTPDIPERMMDVLEAPLYSSDAIVMTSQCGRSVMEAYERHAAARIMERYQVQRIFPGQRPIVPLAVTMDWFSPRSTSSARQALGFTSDQTVLLYMGRLSIDKKGDLSPLLYCFRRLMDRHGPQLILVLAGGGNPANQKLLTQTAQSLGILGNVRILPNVSDDVKHNLYGAADIFVSPIDSLQETFGISIVEAMASGLPVVASGFDGYRELVVDGETGVLIPTLWGPMPESLRSLGVMVEPSVRQLAIAQNVAPSVGHMEEALSTLIRQPELREKMGRAGQQRAREKYAWPVVMKQYLEMWETLSQQLPAQNERNLDDPSGADLFAMFEHYPTHTLQSDQQFVLTELGRQCATGQYPMPSMYGEMAPFYRPNWIKYLVEQTAQGPRTWIDLQQVCASDAKESDLLRFHLLWLVKYGLLTWM